MSRKLKRPLDPIGREIRFFEGDWERLREILAPRKVTPSEFIREMVYRKIRQIDEKAQLTFNEVDDGELTLESSGTN